MPEQSVLLDRGLPPALASVRAAHMPSMRPAARQFSRSVRKGIERDLLRQRAPRGPGVCPHEAMTTRPDDGSSVNRPAAGAVSSCPRHLARPRRKSSPGAGHVESDVRGARRARRSEHRLRTGSKAGATIVASRVTASRVIGSHVMRSHIMGLPPIRGDPGSVEPNRDPGSRHDRRARPACSKVGRRQAPGTVAEAVRARAAGPCGCCRKTLLCLRCPGRRSTA